MQEALRLTLLVRNNFGPGTNEVTIGSTREDHKRGIHAVYLRIRTKRAWRCTAGDYLYVTLPDQVIDGWGLFQAHPYQIAWTEGSTQTRDIVLLVESQRSFSNGLRKGQAVKHSAILDGPYGVHHDLTPYGKVLLLVSGIGIASVLAYARELLKDANARKRRVSLVWLSESRGASGAAPAGSQVRR